MFSLSWAPFQSPGRQMSLKSTDWAWWDAPCSLRQGICVWPKKRKSQIPNNQEHRTKLNWPLQLGHDWLSWHLRYNPCHHTGPKSLHVPKPYMSQNHTGPMLDSIFFGYHHSGNHNESWSRAPCLDSALTPANWAFNCTQSKAVWVTLLTSKDIYINSTFGDWGNKHRLSMGIH